MDRKEKSVLDDMMIAAPCPISWESMDGDEQVRFCGLCSLNVYSISEMTKKEAEQLIKPGGPARCVRLFRRMDGTVITSNCPVGLRKLQKRMRNLLRLAAAFCSVFISAVPWAQAQNGSHRIVGKLAVSARGQAAPAQYEVGALLPPATALPPPPAERSGLHQYPIAGMPALPLLDDNEPTPRVIRASEGLQAESTSKYITEYSWLDSLNHRSGPSGGTDSAGLIKLRAQYDVTINKKSDQPMRADDTALALYQTARVSESDGRLLLALTQYRSALKASAEQIEGDPVFKHFLENEVARMSDKLKNPDSAGSSN